MDSRPFMLCLDYVKNFLFLCFSCEIELIPVKFLRGSCKISEFQTVPYVTEEQEMKTPAMIALPSVIGMLPNSKDKVCVTRAREKNN